VEIWRQKALLHRGLSSVAVTENAVVTGDYKGYVHWLDKATGGLAARVRVSKVRVSNPPVVSGNMVIVIDDNGKINAYRTSPIGATMAGPRKVPDETAAPAAEPSAPAPAPAPAPTTEAAPPPSAPAPTEPAPTPPVNPPQN
jgi:hypothetical protein